MTNKIKITDILRTFLFLSLILIVLSGCDLFGPKKLSDSEAQEVAGEIMSSFMAAVSNAIAGSMDYSANSLSRSVSPVLRTYQAINYSSGGIQVTGGYDYDYTEGTFEYNLDVSFSDYYSGGMTIDGKSSYDINIENSSITGSFDGSFDIEKDGDSYEFSWDISVSGSTVNGTYRINGEQYSYYDAGGFSSPGYDSGDGDTGSGDATTGQICFWTSVGTHGDITIKLNGSYVGTLTQYFSSGSPTFGQSGTLTVTEDPGTHSLYAETQDTALYWSDTITIYAGDQLLFELR